MPSREKTTPEYWTKTEEKEFSVDGELCSWSKLPVLYSAKDCYRIKNTVAKRFSRGKERQAEIVSCEKKEDIVGEEVKKNEFQAESINGHPYGMADKEYQDIICFLRDGKYPTRMTGGTHRQTALAKKRWSKKK